MDSNLTKYLLLSRDLPPDDDFLVKDDGWWGCQWWLVRDDNPPVRAKDLSLSDVFEFVDVAFDRGAVPAEISRAQVLEEGRVAFLVGAAPGLGVDPRFLLYAEAVAEVEEWFYMTNPDRGPDAHWLEGRRGGLRVALVPPFRIVKGQRGPLTVPDEQGVSA